MMIWTKTRLIAVCVAAAVVLGVGMPAAMKLAAQEKPAETKTEKKALAGWRGNWTGRFSEADPPIEWGRVSELMAGLRCQAEKPEDDKPAGVPAHHGAFTEWLVLGPFPSEGLEDAAKDEAGWKPAPGETVQDIAWKKVRTTGSWINFDRIFGSAVKEGQSYTAYAHTYIYAPKEGSVSMRYFAYQEKTVYLNGTPLMKWRGRPRDKAPEVTLKKGWNRVLCRVTCPAKRRFSTFSYPTSWGITLGVHSVGTAKMIEENIVWKTPMMGVGTSSPIIVGEKIFVMAEPGDLVCVNKEDGKVLWRRSLNFYEAAKADGMQDAAILQEVEPLADKLEAISRRYVAGKLQPDDWQERNRLNKEIVKKMQAVYKKDEYYARSTHGNCGSTPVTDGEHICVLLGIGITACFDLDGNRKWINVTSTPGRRPEHGFHSSPNIIEGKFITHRVNLSAFDVNTGRLLWQIKRGDIVDPQLRAAIGEKGRTVGKGARMIGSESILCYPINGKEYIYKAGHLVDPENGKVIWGVGSLVFGIGTPVMDGMDMYGVGKKGKYIKARLSDKDVTVRVEKIAGKSLKQKNSGGANQREFFCSSPLFDKGLLYAINVKGRLSVVDTKTSTLLYHRILGFGPDATTPIYYKGNYYSSPVLAGKYIYIFGAFGTTVVLEPGREYREVARNRILGAPARRPETFISTPIPDGDRFYVRGGKYLYCIGKTE